MATHSVIEDLDIARVLIHHPTLIHKVTKHVIVHLVGQRMRPVAARLGSLCVLSLNLNLNLSLSPSFKPFCVQPSTSSNSSCRSHVKQASFRCEFPKARRCPPFSTFLL